MSILKILQHPNKRLRQNGKPVTDFKNPDLQKTIDNMFETHYAADNCAALAATQLDIVDPPHITVIDFSAKHDQPLCLVNAKIIAREGEQNEEEGCMSVGHGHGVYAKVKRAAKIQVQAFDRRGKALNFSAEGYMAKCIQHELDHLDGKLYIDRLSQLKRMRIETFLKKIKKS
ncbi:MAG: peptide deformylase [Gammaproteobacteria bacterium]|nr:peptide deformylase [Gammaproteobacteria bacterium]